MDSLFTSLRKYRPRENSDPLENFVTEAFAWLLRKSPELGRFIIDHISERLQADGKGFSCNGDVSWSTQENYDGCFPDMEARWQGMTLVFEHKVDASLHDGQLERYRSFHEKYGNDYRLILITRHHYQHAQNPDIALCWYEIYSLIKSYIESNITNDSSWVFQDFLHLLKVEGLAPAAPISHTAISLYQEAIGLQSQLVGLISRLSTHIWPMPNNYVSEIKNKEGVIGIQFNRKNSDTGHVSWTPGVFIGFVINGSDHQINEHLKDGLKMCLNLSIGEKFHKLYSDWPEYTDLVKQMAEGVKSSKHSWVLYNHIEHTKPANAWHPLYITYPLLELFRGTEALKEQEDKFVCMANDAIDILLSCPAFQQLEHKLKQERV